MDSNAFIIREIVSGTTSSILYILICLCVCQHKIKMDITNYYTAEVTDTQESRYYCSQCPYWSQHSKLIKDKNLARYLCKWQLDTHPARPENIEMRCPHTDADIYCMSTQMSPLDPQNQYDLFLQRRTEISTTMQALKKDGYLFIPERLHLSLFVWQGYIRIHRFEYLVSLDSAPTANIYSSYYHQALRVMDGFSTSRMILVDQRLLHQFLYDSEMKYQPPLFSKQNRIKYVHQPIHQDMWVYTTPHQPNFDYVRSRLEQLLHQLILPFSEFGYTKPMEHMYNVVSFDPDEKSIDYMCAGTRVQLDESHHDKFVSDIMWLVNFLFRYGFCIDNFNPQSFEMYATDDGVVRAVLTTPYDIRRIQTLDDSANIKNAAVGFLQSYIK